MSKTHYFYTVDEDQFAYFAKEFLSEGATFNFLFGIQPHEVEKFVFEGTDTLSADEIMDAIDFIMDLKAGFVWWEEFMNPEVGLFSAKDVKEIAPTFDHDGFKACLEDKERLKRIGLSKSLEEKLSNKDNQVLVLKNVDNLEQFFKSASEKGLAIMYYQE